MQESLVTSFDATTSAQDVVTGSDLSGKRIIITGANSGLGKETARVLGTAGASVTLAVRNSNAGNQVAEELRQATGKDNFQVAVLDLSSKQSIRDFTKDFLATNRQLDVLISNAGIMGVEEAYVDGLESQMAVNFLGHFLLSALLSPLLKATKDARVITLASVAHQICNIDFDDFNFENTPYHPMLAYGRSKTASALLAIALHDRLAASDVTSLVVHPGIIHETGLNRDMGEKEIEMIAALAADDAKTIETGSATTVWAATSDVFNGKGGLYLEDCKVAELIETPNFKTGVLHYALDSDAANRLWAQAEQWLGERFDIA